MASSGFQLSRGCVVAALGTTQVLAWGASYYLLAVLAGPMTTETGWSLDGVIGGLSLGLLVSGLVSPKMGRMVQARGGRLVLAGSSVLFALGLGAMALASSLWLYLASWIVMGLGMGLGLYDAAFATLGRLYGFSARGPMTTLTLIGGFSSTITWPLSAYLTAGWGWRGACLAFAALQIAICLPLHLAIPSVAPAEPAPSPASIPAPAVARSAPARELVLLAAVLTLLSGIAAFMAVHVVFVLKAIGVVPSVAIAIATLLGPSQVGARGVEVLFGRHYHPVWTLVAASGLAAAGILSLAGGPTTAAAAVILYGGGIGIAWVARATVPLALFGARAYAERIGRLALPNLIAQAGSPWLGAAALRSWGIAPTLGVLALAAVVTCGLSIWLVRWIRPGP